MRVNAARFRLFTFLVIVPVLMTAPLAAGQQSQTARASKTKIVLLGTGTPAPDPERSGPATGIVVNDTAYLVDFGPGVVRRAAAAFFDKDIRELEPTKLRVAFVTHLHSDHTVGYPDLIFTPWTVGRRVSLEVYGPKGLKAMTEHLLEAYRVDIETRTNADGNQRGFPGGHNVNAHEITPGVVYKDANVTVTAFVTKHAMESYGYRFDTPDRSIVISGDTNPTQATIDACRGCDVLIHEVHTPAWLATRPETFQQFAAKYHTTTPQLAELARQAKPKLLILYHYAGLSREELFDDMLAHYSGHFVVGRDLDIY
jgi:ribonuclease BN (tRNA processing enzyme)